MAISRNRALVRLQGRVFEIERHLSRLAETPQHSSVGKWRSEVRNWLREMEEVIANVGKKTGAKWQARIDAYRARLEDDTELASG